MELLNSLIMFAMSFRIQKAKKNHWILDPWTFGLMDLIITLVIN